METLSETSTKHTAGLFNAKHSLKQAPKHAAASLKVKQTTKHEAVSFWKLNKWPQFLCKPCRNYKGMLCKTMTDHLYVKARTV